MTNSFFFYLFGLNCSLNKYVHKEYIIFAIHRALWISPEALKDIPFLGTPLKKIILRFKHSLKYSLIPQVVLKQKKKIVPGQYYFLFY